MTESNPNPDPTKPLLSASGPDKPSVRFDAPKDVKGSDRKAIYDRTEGRFVTGPGEPGKDAPAFKRVKGHAYATVRV